MASLTDSLRGLGINTKGGNVTTTQQQEALQSLIDTANQVSKDNGLGSKIPFSTGRHATSNILSESSKEAHIFENRLKHVEGHYANQEHKGESNQTGETDALFNLRQLQADEEQHCSAAGLRTRYMEKHNLGKKIRVSNASSGVTGLFDSTPQSEKSAVKAPGDKDSSHGFTLIGRQSDNHRKWKKQQLILAASRRKILEKVRASGHETRDIFLKFNRGESGEVSVSNFVDGLQNMGIHLAENDVESIADIVDPKNTGIVSFAEFAKAVDGIDAAYTAEKKHETVQDARP